MSFRKEQKYRLTFSDLVSVKQRLIALGMQKLHEERDVNSVYFDTDNFSMFFASEEGLTPRKKVRIRWYGYQKTFSKETKFSTLEGRYKTTSSLVNFVQSDLPRIKYIDSQYGEIIPSLHVSYLRSYFSLYSLRVTFDTDINYTNPRSQSMLEIFDPECVAEIKAPLYCDDDFIANIWPAPTARFSKYSRGLLAFGIS